MITLNNYSGKNVAVLGLGVTGISVVNALKRSGANVFAWDDNNIPNLEGVSFVPPVDYNWSTMDEIIVSPGVPLKYPKPNYVITLAQGAGCPISCDIDLLYQAEQQEKFVGITGTNGKSTTASLVQHILQQNGINSCLGGNIGIPVLDLVSGAKIYVLEISSYQLDLCSKIKFDIGVLLNITPDHLDRHGSMDNYIAAKKKICGKHSIISLDSDVTQQVYNELKIDKTGFSTRKILEEGTSIVANTIYHSGKVEADIPDNEIVTENLIAAYTTCSLLGLRSEEIITAIKTFKNLPHRNEFVRKINNVTFINDSKATNAISTSLALQKFSNIYWIAGGIAKAGGITGLKLDNVHKTFLIGEASEDFAQYLSTLNKPYVKAQTLANAVTLAYSDAKNTSAEVTIILSPACSSFDQWQNFAARGDAFKKVVENL